MPRINPLNIILHIAGWTLFLSLPILFLSAQFSTTGIWSILISADALIFFVTYLFIFYFHSYYLFPNFYLKKKFVLYAATLVLIVAAVWMLKPFDRLMRKTAPEFLRQQFQRPPEGSVADRPDNFSLRGTLPPDAKFIAEEMHRRHPIDMVSLFLLIMTLGFSLAAQFRHQARAAEQKALEATADKTRAELFFLKAQIQPHFLFNTLNNIYSLAVRNDPNTAAAILKLSNILRYTTDEASNNFVSLESEVDFLHDYVDLQRLRLGEKMDIDLQISGQTENKKIAPLLLMTFVENAFKYGVSNHETSLIRIYLSAREGRLHFLCENNLFSKPRNAERTGIGIANTQKRLEQLYPGNYTLNIQSQHNKYTVELHLPDQ